MTDTLQPCDTCDGTGEVVSTCHDEHDAGRKRVRCVHNHTDLFGCPSCLGVGRVPTETVIDKVAEAIGDYAGLDSNWSGTARAAVQAYLKETL